MRKLTLLRVWPALAVAVAVAGILTTAALAQVETGSATITFTISEPYGVIIQATIPLDEVAPGTAGTSVSFGTTSADHLFEIIGPASPGTESITMGLLDTDIPLLWVYDWSPETPPTSDEVLLHYEATAQQFRQANAVAKVGIPEPFGETANLVATPPAPRGHYGGTLTVQLGAQNKGDSGEASLVLGVTVTQAAP